MHEQFYLADRQVLVDASELVTAFGPSAKAEARSRANRSRDLGNVISFCHWRQIARYLDWLNADDAAETIH